MDSTILTATGGVRDIWGQSGELQLASRDNWELALRGRSGFLTVCLAEGLTAGKNMC